MSYRYKLGLPEVISIIIGTTAMVLLAYFSRMIDFSFTYELEVVIITSIAIVFGTLSALICSIASSVLIFMILGGISNYVVVLILIGTSFFIGHYAPKFGVREGKLVGKSFWDLFILRLTADTVSWMFVLPFFSFLIYKTDQYEMLQAGVVSLIFTTACNVVLLPILWMVNRTEISYFGNPNAPVTEMGDEEIEFEQFVE